MVCGMCLRAHAVTPQSLADSLNAFASGYAVTDPVKVKSIRQKGRTIAVYTNHSLGCLSLSEEDLRLLRTKVSEWVRGDNYGTVSIYSDKYELDELVTSRFRARPAKDRHRIDKETPLTENISRPYSVSKGLEKKHIALWASHGLYYKQDEQVWHWQRARLWTTVEDLYTSSYTIPFLVPMLENAGAVVIQPRERDPQTEEVITTGKNGQYTPAIKKEGDYAVYVRYKAGSGNTRSAIYKVLHKGQETVFRVNQQAGGGIWIYLGTFGFGTNPADNRITLLPQGEDGKDSDAGEVRLGGGMGSIARYPWAADSITQARYAELAVTSGYPRFMEGARYWLEYNGVPDSIYSYTEGKNDYTDDLSCRGRWVNYLAGGSSVLPKQEGLNIPINMSVALHSDAGTSMDDTQIGTLTIYTDHDNDRQNRFPAGGDRLVSRDLADKIQTQVVEDIRRTLGPDWPRRSLKNASYSESRMPKVPCALIELLSHQNLADMRLGLDPAFKFLASRAIYKGILRFLHEQDGTPYVVQPLPVKAFRIRRSKPDEVELTWEERPDTLESTARPAYYILYTREEGKDWDNGVRIPTHGSLRSGITTRRLKTGRRYDFRICAGNDGGLSLPGEVLSACLMPDSAPTALIINAFTRVAPPEMSAVDSLTGGIIPGSQAVPYGTEVAYIGAQCDFDRRHEWLNDDECGFGMCHADHANELTAGNTFDYPVMHGRVLQAAGYSYVSTSREAAAAISPEEAASYSLMAVIMGKQKEEQGTYWSPALKQLMQAHLSRGGHLLVSGSYLAGALHGNDDIRFASRTLHYTPHSTKATHNGHLHLLPPFGRDSHRFPVEPNGRIICCEAADGIEPADNAAYAARYEDSGVCAGIVWNSQLAVFPFVMESVENFEGLYNTCLRYFQNGQTSAPPTEKDPAGQP